MIRCFPPRGDCFVYCMIFAFHFARLFVFITQIRKANEFPLRMGDIGIREPNERGAALKLAMNFIGSCFSQWYTLASRCPLFEYGRQLSYKLEITDTPLVHNVICLSWRSF